MTWLVWVQGLAGPTPEKWSDAWLRGSADGTLRPHLKLIELPKDVERWPLADLAKAYPYEGGS